MTINPNTLEFMVLIFWWFACLWLFRIAAIALIGKGVGEFGKKAMSSISGRQPPDHQRETAGSSAENHTRDPDGENKG